MCFCFAKTLARGRRAMHGETEKSTGGTAGQRPNPRFTTAEKVEIAQHAAILGVSPSDFIRRRSLSYRLPVALAVQRHVAACAVALLRLGVNLNQIARRMNAGRARRPNSSP
jgi:hypothetical protein